MLKFIHSMEKTAYMFAAGIIFFFIFTSAWAFISILFPNRLTSGVTPGDYGLAFDDVRLETKDSVSLAGWFVPQQKREEGAVQEEVGKSGNGKRAIILTHGYPADKGDILSTTLFLAQEYDLLYIDFRRLGNSEGVYSSVGIDERKDLQAAIAFLEERGYEEIGLWGFSVGGATTLMEAPKHKSVMAVVSISSYARLSDMAESAFRIPYINRVLAEMMRGYAYVFFGEDIKNVSPADAMMTYEKPVYIIHPQNDQVIPLSHGKQIEDALADNPHAQFWYPDGVHGFVPPSEHTQRVKEFFNTHLTNE